ncbi:MAG: aquaporin [Bacillota bacterium]|nr:aquaporin [Bacillota bacterium]
MKEKEVPWLRASLAELGAVFFFVGGSLFLFSQGAAAEGSRAAASFLSGFLYMAAVYGVAHISGAQLHPALTLTLWVTHRLSFGRMAALMGGQFLGAGAAWLLVRTLEHPGPEAWGFFLPEKEAAGGTLLLGMGFFTFFLTFSYYATLLDGRAAPGIFGLTLGAVMAAGAFLGFPLHPGEAVALQALAQDFSQWWALSLGSLLGALLGGLLYEGLLDRRGESHPLP